MSVEGSDAPFRPAPRDEDRVGPERRHPRKAPGRSQHVDIPKEAGGVVGEGLAQAVLLVRDAQRTKRLARWIHTYNGRVGKLSDPYS